MRYTNLQAGRFVAAVAVLVFHVAVHAHDQLGLSTNLIEPVPTYGFRTSIIFFFALSGFVLAHGLQNASLRSFLAARFLRLYPAYWIVATSVLVVRELAGRPLTFDLKSLGYAFLLWPAGPGRAGYSIGIEWTLVYEILLSVALIPFAALGRRWGLGIGSAILLALIVGKVVLDRGQVFRPFPKLSEFPLAVLNSAFLLGVLAYLARNHLPRWRWAMPVLAIGGLAAGTQWLTSAIGWSILLQSVGTVAAVCYFVTGPQLPARTWLVRAGDWSYGIYLAHVPVMTAVFALAAKGSLPIAPLPAAILGGTLALTVGSVYGALEWRIYRRLRSANRNSPPAQAMLPVSNPSTSLPKAA